MIQGKVVDENTIELSSLKNAALPSNERLRLNRSTISKYSLPRHLSPLKTYRISLDGELKLTELTPATCRATLQLEISAYEYVWFPLILDDGYRSSFTSNGVLEQCYLEAIAAQFQPAARKP